MGLLEENSIMGESNHILKDDRTTELVHKKRTLLQIGLTEDSQAGSRAKTLGRVSPEGKGYRKGKICVK